jgi:hypothetical protein
MLKFFLRSWKNVAWNHVTQCGVIRWAFMKRVIFGFHKTWVISWIAEKLLIIQGLCCMEVAKILNENHTVTV